MSIQVRKAPVSIVSSIVKIDLATLFRKAVWLGIVLVSITYSVVGSRHDLVSLQTDFQKWVYVYLNFLSFVLGVVAGALIFFRKPKSWMAFAIGVMLVTFTATNTGYGFWQPLLLKFFSAWANSSSVAYSAALFMDILYLALMTTSLAFVLLAFPDEKLPSRNARWFFNLMVLSQVLLLFIIGALFLYDIISGKGGDLSYRVYSQLDNVKSILLIILSTLQIRRLRRITDPVMRQKIKWIVSSLIGMTFFYAVGTTAALLLKTVWIPVWAFLPGLIFTYGFIITLVIAMIRYRFWDMSFFINRALVYSAVTAVLGVLGFAGAELLEFFAKQLMSSNAPLVGAFILLPLAALFNPLRDGMQVMVDRYLKPEEVDFSSAIVEIAPEAQLMLSSQDILKILVRQSVEQVNISGATIFLRQQDGQLTQREPAVIEPEAPQFHLDDKTRRQLEQGKVVVPSEGSPFSLYIPLVINRAARPDFLGVLVFGSRDSGEGYPTPVLKSLQKLGCDAGKAIYLAELREHLGRNITDRLAAIESRLSVLNKPADA